MRWPLGRGRRSARRDGAPSRGPAWADRLGTIGRAIDATGLGLRDLALSLAGGETWVCACVWRSGRLHGGWAALTLRLEGSHLVPVAAAASLLDPRAGGFVGVPWEPRLSALGLLLDRTGATLRDPWIVETRGGFVVTGLELSAAAPGHWTPVSREFAATDLAVELPGGKGKNPSSRR